jgi:hypothetical protein
VRRKLPRISRSVPAKAGRKLPKATTLSKKISVEMQIAGNQPQKPDHQQITNQRPVIFRHSRAFPGGGATD